MDMLTYFMITVTYGLGCFLSYRLGYFKGMGFGIDETTKMIAEMSDQEQIAIISAIRGHRQRKALKAKGA